MTRKTFRALILPSFLIMLSVILLVSCENSVREMSVKRFEQMVKDGEVEQIVIGNDDIAKIWLTPEATKKSKYQGWFSDEQRFNSEQPHLILHIISEEAFREDLASLKPNFPIISDK